MWLEAYGFTLKPGYRETAKLIIEKHLVAFFGSHDLRELHEDELLRYVRTKLGGDRPLAPATVRGHLAVLARVCSLLQRKRVLAHNPCIGLGELFKQVGRAASEQVHEVDAWSREEVTTLLGLAREHEAAFYPLLALLLGTGLRRGEALALRWEDVDFAHGRLHVRRSWSKGHLSTPKNGKGRRVALPGGLVDLLSDLRAERQRQGIKRGWAGVPEWVFCSESGSLLDERNVGRVWDRLRRRAQKKDVRPLKLHSARHTYATLALGAGKSVRWVAEQLGHGNPAFTMRVYAHAMREEETDLGFADFSVAAKPRKSTAHRRPMSVVGPS